MCYDLCYVLLYTSATSDSDAEQRRGCSEIVLSPLEFMMKSYETFIIFDDSTYSTPYTIIESLANWNHPKLLLIYASNLQFTQNSTEIQGTVKIISKMGRSPGKPWENHGETIGKSWETMGKPTIFWDLQLGPLFSPCQKRFKRGYYAMIFHDTWFTIQYPGESKKDSRFCPWNAHVVDLCVRLFG